jgi:hypothetical protein
MSNRKSGPGSRQGRPCHICRHPERGRIEHACGGTRSHYEIAREFGVTRFSVDRHWANHVSPSQKAQLLSGAATIAELAERAAKEDRSLVDYLSILRSELLRLFLRARDDGKVFEASHIAQRLLSTLESLGKLTGQLRSAGISITNINGAVSNSVSSGPTLIMNDPQIVKMQATIIRALAPHPEARRDVIAALRDLDAQPVSKGLNGGHEPSLAISANPSLRSSP